MHVVFWASGLVLLGTQCGLAFAQRRDSVFTREIVWAVVPALFLVGLGLFGSAR